MKLTKWLEPLGFPRPQWWITDCLDTYRLSKDQASRIDDTYGPFAATHGLAPANVGTHPSESAIVTEALRLHLDRLRAELSHADPEAIVTLGNAALRTLVGVLRLRQGEGPGNAVGRGARYGVASEIRVGDRVVPWYPLAHPAAPPAYRRFHAAWQDRVRH